MVKLSQKLLAYRIVNGSQTSAGYAADKAGFSTRIIAG
jgi:hypothetical protein